MDSSIPSQPRRPVTVLSRVGETDYFRVVDPDYLQAARCGEFYHRPDFPDRHDANQLIRVRCDADDVVEEVERLYEGTGLAYRKVSGYDPVVWKYLGPELEARGWTVSREAMKVWRREPKGPPDTKLVVRDASPVSPDLETLFRNEDGSLDRGFVFEREEYARVGGQYFVGYHRGEPVSCTGWFSAGDVARYRYVYTIPSARGHGFASTLLRYVQKLPTVQDHEELAIFVAEEWPDTLYESMGFDTVGWFWSAFWREGGGEDD